MKWGPVRPTVSLGATGRDAVARRNRPGERYASGPAARGRRPQPARSPGPEEAMMCDNTGVRCPPRRARQPRSLTVALLAVAGLGLLAAACGGTPGSGVAQLGSTTTQRASSGAPNAGGPTSSRPTTSEKLLAFSHCMRSHGVQSFPDPNATGVLPKSQIARLAASNPQFVAAHRACGHLLPNSGQPTEAQVQQAWNDMRDFAHCMRSHGVPNWPDPTFTSPQDHRPFFNTPASIDPNAPQVSAKVRACQHVMHFSNPLVTTQ